MSKKERYLSPEHQKMLLEESAIDPVVAEERGYFTATKKSQLEELGFQPRQARVPALVCPLRGVSGEIGNYCSRPEKPRIQNGKPAKYEFPAGSRMILDVPARVREQLGNPREPLFITEGAKKADSGVTNGLCCISLIGVWNWRGRNEDGGLTALADWESIALNDRVVYLTFDSDVMTKPEVHLALKRLRSFLKKRGAKIKVVYLPAGENGAKVGLDDFFASGGRVEELMKLATNRLKPCPNGRSLRSQYTRRKSGMYLRLQDGKLQRLSNFTAEIVEDTLMTDGVERTRRLRVRAKMEGKAPVECTLTTDEFSRLDWPLEFLGAKAIISPGRASREHLAAAIQETSNPEEKLAYGHTGWAEHKGQPVYLHRGGALGPDGPVPEIGEVVLPECMRSFLLPDPPKGKTLQDAVRSSLKLLELGPLKIMVPLLASVYAAILGKTGLTIFIYGATGLFKSQIAAVSQQHYGPGFEAEYLPAGWSSTANAIEELAFIAKDAILVIDDFVAGDQSGMDKIHVIAERVIRNGANGSARQRLTSDARLRAPRPPRCLPLVTGEDLPRGQSLRARTVFINVSAGDIQPEQLSIAQKNGREGLYAKAAAAFIQWVAKNKRQVDEQVLGRQEKLREEFNNLGHRRTAKNLATLGSAFRVFLEFAIAERAVSDDSARKVWKAAKKALLQVGSAQSRIQEGSDPARLFLKLLYEALSSGRAHVISCSARGPAPSTDGWGWVVSQVGEGPRGRGDEIGSLDESKEELYLSWEPALAVVRGLAKECGEALAVSSETLLRRLSEAGFILSEKDREGLRFTLRRTIFDKRRRVVVVPIRSLRPDWKPRRED
ncbi:MAG: DUF3854 domain-containing protein [Planctomycetota bacterium]